jgi:hypothetical protein
LENEAERDHVPLMIGVENPAQGAVREIHCSGHFRSMAQF